MAETGRSGEREIDGPDLSQTAVDVRRGVAIPTIPEHEAFRRDQEFKRSIGVSNREGILWDQAWAAARAYYLSRGRSSASSVRERRLLVVEDGMGP